MEELFLAQDSYRRLLAVMSRPGTVDTLHPEITEFWPSGVTAIAATLVDQEVGFHVVGDAELSRAIGEATGGRQTELEAADFIFVPKGRSRGQVARAKCGSQEFPDEGATIIYQVGELDEAEGGGDITLKGPGIKDVAKPFIAGLALEELRIFTELNAQYPLGVDFILVDTSNRIMALPRSLRISYGGKK